MKCDPLVSVIMPAWNAAQFIQDAINSVVSQSYSNWQLIIINDGSTDATEEIIFGNRDPRILYVKQPNRGVSAARNTGLRMMSGDYFCFLDADDVLPSRSLEARLRMFVLNPHTEFVDGTVMVFDEKLDRRFRIYEPSFSGSPLKLLFKLSDKCFFGPTWMIRRQDQDYRMDEALTHGEDLFFYMVLCRAGGHYDYVREEILYYRRHPLSAMCNIDALYLGYKRIYRYLTNWPEFSLMHRLLYWYKVKKSISLSYLSRGRYVDAFKTMIS